MNGPWCDQVPDRDPEPPDDWHTDSDEYLDDEFGWEADE